MRTLKTLMAAVAVTLALGACATAGARPDNPFAESSSVARSREASSVSRGREAAMVKVQNQNWQDVVVYVVQSGHRIRLGMVTSMTTAHFRLPTRFLGSGADIRLVADPIGGTRGYTTERLSVHSGQEVAFSVQNSLALSSVAIWDRR